MKPGTWGVLAHSLATAQLACPCTHSNVRTKSDSTAQPAKRNMHAEQGDKTTQAQQNSQVFDILALLNFVKLFTLPAVQSTQEKDANKAR